MTERGGYLVALVVVILVAGVAVTLQPMQATLIVGFCATVVASLMGLLQVQKSSVKVAEVAETAKKAASLVEEVAVKQAVSDAKADDLISVTRATHTLVNSNYGLALLSTLMALKDVARLTVDPAGKAIAEAAVTEATRLYDEHQRKQATLDHD